MFKQADNQQIPSPIAKEQPQNSILFLVKFIFTLNITLPGVLHDDVS